MVTQSRNESKSELEGTVGIVWLNPLIFQVRTLRARELLGLVWNHSTQLGGEGELHLGSQTPRPWDLFPCTGLPPSLLRYRVVWVWVASSTLVPMSLTASASRVRWPLPPTCCWGVDQLPPGVQGWNLSPSRTQGLLFHFWKE